MTVKGETPILAGISVFPESFTVAPAAMVVGVLITKTGRYRWAIWSGWVLTTFGAGLPYLLDAHTSTVAWIFLNLVSGIGMGVLFPSTAFAVQVSSTNANVAFAVAIFSFYRVCGQAVGVAFGGSIFQNQMRFKLLIYPSLAPMATQYSRDAASLVETIREFPAGLDKANHIKSYSD